MTCFVKEVVQIAALIFHDYLPVRISGDKFFAVFINEKILFVYVDQSELGQSITEKPKMLIRRKHLNWVISFK